MKATIYVLMKSVLFQSRVTCFIEDIPAYATQIGSFCTLTAWQVYLTTRVEYDSDVDKEPVSTWGYKKMKCSEFARVYEGILKDKKIEACRVNVHGFDDLDALKYEKKLPAATAKIQGSDKM